MTADEQNSGFGVTPLRPTEALDGGIIDPPAEKESTQAEDTVERLAIRVGGLNLLCDPDAGREVLLPPTVSRLPYTPAWLLGVANVRGALVPVADLALAFGFDRRADHRTYLLISGRGENTMGLLVDGLPVLQHLDSSKRLDGIPPHPEMLKGHVRGAIAHAGSTWLDVELNGLFRTLGERIAQAA